MSGLGQISCNIGWFSSESFIATKYVFWTLDIATQPMAMKNLPHRNLLWLIIARAAIVTIINSQLITRQIMPKKMQNARLKTKMKVMRSKK
jgi:hypothetical protein